MYPRDPGAPPGETINCGCVSLPYMDDWTVAEPGRVSFTEREQRLNPRKRDIEGGFAAKDMEVLAAFARPDDVAAAGRWLAGLRRDGLAGYDHLADGELLAIRLYSTNAVYERLNRALRGGDADPAVRAWRALLDRALGRLPVHEGVVARGTDLPEDVLRGYRAGRRYSDRGFLSTSTDKGFGGSVTFQITSRAGRSIAPLSAYPDEAEVLFQSGAEFSIIKKSTRRVGGKGGRPITRLVMDERHKIEDIQEAHGEGDAEARKRAKIRARLRWCDERYAQLKPELDAHWAEMYEWPEPLTDWQRNFQRKGEGWITPGSIKSIEEVIDED